MARFLLLDPNIVDYAGHYYEYAAHVLRAAAEAGYTPVLATNRLFRPAETAWATHPLYRFGLWLHQSDPWLARFVRQRPGESGTSGVPGKGSPGRALLKRGFRAIRQGQFYRDTRRFLRAMRLSPGDIVFLPNMQEVELAGLVRYLREDPASRQASWHLLFRVNIFDGRPPDDAPRETAALLGQAFAELAACAATQTVDLLTDTDALTDQYNRLGVGVFRTAPIPHTTRGQELREPHAPLRLVYLGDARREKGYQHLPALVDNVRADYLATGRAQCVFQSNFTMPGGETDAVQAREALAREEGVELLYQPLTPEAYRALLLSADIILLPYDPTVYLARSSGVFVEALSAGIPVVAPAGSWMARQLCEEQYRYHQQFRARAVSLGVAEASGNPAVLPVPPGATHALLSVTPPAPLPYHLTTVQVTPEIGIPHTALFEEQAGRSIYTALLPLADGASRIALRAHTAGARPVPPALTVEFLKAEGALPLAVIGYIFSGPDSFGQAVREVLTQYAHYRRTAEAFAPQWYERHHAMQLVRVLQQVTHPAPR